MGAIGTQEKGPRMVVRGGHTLLDQALDCTLKIRAAVELKEQGFRFQ
jgi:hypothetical protein